MRRTLACFGLLSVILICGCPSSKTTDSQTSTDGTAPPVPSTQPNSDIGNFDVGWDPNTTNGIARPVTSQPLSHIGNFDPNWNPVVRHGLEPASVAARLGTGWQRDATTGANGDVYMVFASSDLPGGYSVWKTRIPPGTKYIFKEDTGHATIQECGNPTCWRWLVNRPEARVPPMINEGLYDPAAAAVVSGGVTEADRARLLGMGWRRAQTPDRMKNVEMAAKGLGADIPVLLRKYDVPAGTEYYYNPLDGRAIIAAGGNATVWEWLAKQRTDVEQ